MNVAVVDDLQLARDRVEDELRKRNQEGRGFTLVGQLSERIESGRHFSRLLGAIQTFVGDLIIILDAGLDLDLSIKTKLRQDYEIPSDVKDHQVDGCVVAIEALKNTKISPLLIIIATNLGNVDEMEGFLVTVLERNRPSGSAKIIRSHHALGAKVERTGEILDFAFLQFRSTWGGPLERIISHTSDWFKDETPCRVKPPYLKHTFDPMINLDIHRQVVQTVWPWFPNDWWSSDKSAKNLHENLKCLCGRHCSWMTQSAKNSLSVGAAYLLLLECMEHACPGSSSKATISSFQELHEATNPLIGNQEQNTAYKTVKALCDVFLSIGFDRETRECTVESVNFDPPGRRLKVTLSWDADTKFAGYESTLLDVLEKNKPFPDRGTTWRTLMDYLIMSQINSKGFGSPGRIHLEKRILQIGL